ncbi:hypothetical protein [Leptospira santarosai]|uniref:hypothetical protein n=1 Tax=Leptospira santarosai TaxID=28183 RepID=UPI00029827F7|nr:hypothetical protein [Leptospira santarosai]EKS06913.1 hypothetical protein LEP1GSC071_1700 [Leptospira santarosai str. JET]EMO14671.1 hypothetical protein LEP1GSC165_0375 [Leptospira santarosai str. CBC523]MDI7182876.1 hypothetical protein [Leptospira santarosai]
MFLPFAHFQNQNQKNYIDPANIGGVNQGESIFAMVQVGNILYIGGYFTAVGGVSRYRIAAIDTITGNVIPNFLSPGIGGGGDQYVTALTYANGMLLVAGVFTRIGGQNRNGIAAVDPSSGNVLPWYPTGGISGSSNPNISKFAVKGNVLYIAGAFTGVGGVSRNRIAALDLTTAAVLPWYPSGGLGSGLVKNIVLSEDQNTIFVCGSFISAGGQSKQKIVSFDANTGAVLSFTFPTFTTVSSTCIMESIFQKNGKLYIAGNFNTIAGQSRNGFAVLDSVTGNLLSLYPINGIDWPSPNIYSILNKGNTLYVFGYFSSIGGQSRICVASLDSETLKVLSWYPAGGVPGLNSTIQQAFQCGEDAAWIFGFFSIIGGQNRNGIAKLNLF